MNDTLILRGLDGANPLAFLAALGVLVLSSRVSRRARLSWRILDGGWHAEIRGCAAEQDDLAQILLKTLELDRNEPYSIDSKLPFSVTRFRGALQNAAAEAANDRRRECDLLAAFGTDAHQDDKGAFPDTAFRMVRSGDSAGQGLPAYALAIRKRTDAASLHRTLFEPWRYEDDDSSLRWDPAEDQRYALRWYDPSPQSNRKYSMRTMRGANCLALEGLALMPVQPTKHGAGTTGFTTLERRRQFLTWPIWEAPANLDVVRSIVSLSELQQAEPPRKRLSLRGISEIYRSERIAPNQYYKNFGPSRPA
jgi:hypothetical protein